MRFLEKIKQKQADMHTSRQPVIAFLGDSVTHGCFDLYRKNDEILSYTEMGKAYHEKIKEIFRLLYPDVQITAINAGIGGDTAVMGKDRLQRDVLSFSPDLVVVCFGLNDACFGEAMLSSYVDALKEIFDRVRQSGAEVIFLTPNTRADALPVRFFDEMLNACVEGIVQNENQGWLDRYLDAARALCVREQVPVCDCHKIWKQMKENGVDTNFLLANRVNHPVEKMHWLFAYELVKTIFNS